jgi:hypothetical protein
MDSQKSLKFTVELQGFSLPKSVQEEISKELNQLVMKKLGELDLGNNDKATALATRSSLGLVDLINGGEILMLNSQFVKDFQLNFGKVFDIKNGKGITLNIQKQLG